MARFAADLCARGKVVPGLDRAGSAGPGGGWTASWRTVLTGPDAPRAAELAGAMPPVCRASEPGGEPPGPLLAGALDALADAAARARLDRAGGSPGWTLLPPRRGRRPARVPVAERWATALTGPDAEVEVASEEDEAEVAALAASLDDWRATAQAPAGPVRTCFRLVEPLPPDTGPDRAAGDDQPAPSADGPWHVEFALQATDDPSLMLPADDVWAGTGGWAPGGITRPDEELLAGLGSATRLFGELEDALRAPAPAAVALDTAGAFRFLKETGPLLSGAGFGVLLPDWARKARLGLKLTSRAATGAAPSSPARPGGANGPGFGLNDLVEFRYDLAVGDTTLDADELAELAQLKIPLVRVRGQWVELDDRNLRAALTFMERGRSGVMRAGDVLVAGLRGPEDDLEVTAVDGGRVARRPALRAVRPVADPGDRPRVVPRRPAPLPGAGPGLADLPQRPGPGRDPGRRHGPGQERADAGAAGPRAGAAR